MKNFIKGFYYAGRGFVLGLKERNMRVHLVVAVIVISLGLYFEISNVEWFAVIIGISMVLAAELFNTAIEDICNTERDELNVNYELSGRPRDLAAGAVLVTTIGAGLIGLVIFIPKILEII